MAEKLEKIKNILKKDKKLLIVLILAVAGIFLLLISEIATDKETVENDSVSVSTEQYASMLETKLESIISAIDGAGKAEVMVTVETGEENVYARQVRSEEEKNDSKSSAQYEYDYVVIKSGSSQENGMLLKVIEPDIRGVAVVCEGGDNAAVRENIINSVSAVLDIKTNKISVCKSKG